MRPNRRGLILAPGWSTCTMIFPGSTAQRGVATIRHAASAKNEPPKWRENNLINSPSEEYRSQALEGAGHIPAALTPRTGKWEKWSPDQSWNRSGANSWRL